jgi:hypothetical protein
VANDALRRLAIFVEGFTEVQFATRLIEEVAGKQNVAIEHRTITGGSSVPKRIVTLRAARKDGDERFYVLIVDCQGDSQVKSRILEEHESLTKAGYLKIIGIRDVRPQFTRADIPKLVANLRKYVKTSLAPVEFVLAVMEVEAWFLAEYNHFSKLDPKLTVASIKAVLGFDPALDDMSMRTDPTGDLDSCYALVGHTYRKSESRTAEALDYAHIYVDLSARIPYLGRLNEELDAFLAAQADENPLKWRGSS